MSRFEICICFLIKKSPREAKFGKCHRLPPKYNLKFSTITFSGIVLRRRPKKRKTCLARGCYKRNCKQRLAVSLIPPLVGNTQAEINKIEMAKKVILLLVIASVVCSPSPSLLDVQIHKEAGPKIFILSITSISTKF